MADLHDLQPSEVRVSDHKRNCFSCRWWSDEREKCMNPTPIGTELGDDLDNWIEYARIDAAAIPGNEDPCTPWADGCPGHAFKSGAP